MRKFAIIAIVLCAPLPGGTNATQTETSAEFDNVPMLFEGAIGEWTDVYTVEYVNESWRHYEMDFVKRIERLNQSHIRVHRVHGPPPLDVEISPPTLRVSWPNGDGKLVLVTESEIERLDIQGPTDWNLLIRTDWNGEEIWMEMILSGDVFTYLRWRESPDGIRQYTRIHWMKRIPD